MLQRIGHIWFNQQQSLSKLSSRIILLLLFWLMGVWVAQSLDAPQAPNLPDFSVDITQGASRSGTTNLIYGQTDKPMASADERKVDAASLTDTRLKLVLLGTIKTGSTGVAIMANGANTLVVSEGEQVINGVELVEVAADYVVLLHRGKHERLAMEDRIAGLVTEESKPESMDSGAGLSLSSAEQGRLKRINEEIRENPMRMGNYVRFKGIKQNGTWVGIEVSPRREHKIFEAMGLKPGDLIKSINGTQIQELADAPTLWNRFLQESRFDLQVERNGMLETISVDLTNVTE